MIRKPVYGSVKNIQVILIGQRGNSTFDSSSSSSTPVLLWQLHNAAKEGSQVINRDHQQVVIDQRYNIYNWIECSELQWIISEMY